MEKALCSDEGRYQSVDVLRLVCSFLVVCIHCSYDGVIYYWFEPVTRVAVPIFFMISGFFWSKVCEQGKQWKTVVKLIRLFSIWYLFYVIVQFVICGGGVKSEESFLREAAKMILANKPLFVGDNAGHLWYLSALIYVYVFFNFAYQFQQVKLISCIGIMLILPSFLIGNYSWILGIESTGIWTRNFLMTGIPYFSLGLMIWNNRLYLLNYYKEKRQVVFWGAVVLFLVGLNITEKFYLTHWSGLNKLLSDTYLITPILSLLLFVLTLKKDKYGVRTNFGKSLSVMGKQVSTGIYLIHPLIINILIIIMQEIKISHKSIVFHLLPIIVWGLTMISVFILNNIKAKIGSGK